jgi:hypothetical protein
MTTIVLLIVGFGFFPTTFASIALCEQAWRDVLQAIDQGQPIRHVCMAVRVR